MAKGLLDFFVFVRQWDKQGMIIWICWLFVALCWIETVIVALQQTLNSCYVVYVAGRLLQHQYGLLTAGVPSSIDYPGPTPERVVRHGNDGGKCLACGKVYSSLGYAQRHYEMVHSSSGPRLKCFRCDKTLKHEASLQHHLRIQHGIYQNKIGQMPSAAAVDAEPAMIVDVTIEEGDGTSTPFGKLPKISYNDDDNNPLE